MTGKVEYLERYSVAPSPSRDYHGLKILRDEVILYVWRISHGPHKAPIVRRSKFFEFDRDKALQDEIGRIFGDHLVNYIKLIARGKGNSLLTLPRSSIERIIGYLNLEDIVNLTALSRIANVVFNDNFVWEALYRRHKSFKIGRKEKEYAMAYGWKQAFKEKQTALSTERRKAIDSAPTTATTTAGKREKLKTPKETTRSVGGSLKMTSKSSSASVKAETVRSLPRKSSTNLLRSLKDPEIDDAAIKLDKKTNTSNTRIKKNSNVKTRQTKNPKSLRNDKSSVQLVESKHDIREAFSDSMTATRGTLLDQQRRVKQRKASVSAKVDNVRTTDKGKIGDTKKNLTDMTRFSSTKSRNEAMPKEKEKPKRSTAIKSTSSSVDETFLQDTASLLGNENCELAYLIEESLKRIRSPRTIFDYDFSYLEGSKTLVNSKKKNEESRKGIATIEDANAGNENEGKLDRLSEYSDSWGTPSTNSIVIENRDEKTREKTKAKEKIKSKVATAGSGRIERSMGSYETSSKESPKETVETYDIIGPSVRRGPTNSIDVTKSLRPTNLTAKSNRPIGTTGKIDLGTTAKNRFALKKKTNESRKDRSIDTTD